MSSNDAVSQGESYPGFSPSTYGAPAYMPPAPVTQAPVPQFRPLSTGEVLDRTFTLYRQRFWLFVGIGMVPGGALLVMSALRLLFLTLTHRADLLQPRIGTPLPMGSVLRDTVMLQLYALPAAIVFLIAYGISNAATTDAVNRSGQSMATSAGIAFREVRGRWLRWSGIVLRQFWSMMWPMLPGVVGLFGSVAMIARLGAKPEAWIYGLVALAASLLMAAGFVLGVINFIRYTLAVPAGVSENLGVNASMRRSKTLVAGHKGRIFLAWLLMYALQLVVAAVQAPLLFAAVSLRGGAFIAVQAVMMLVQFAGVTLVAPIASIAFTLFYIDERVRREGFDIELLMRRTLPAAAPAYTPEI